MLISHCLFLYENSLFICKYSYFTIPVKFTVVFIFSQSTKPTEYRSECPHAET